MYYKPKDVIKVIETGDKNLKYIKGKVGTIVKEFTDDAKHFDFINDIINPHSLQPDKVMFLQLEGDQCAFQENTKEQWKIWREGEHSVTADKPAKYKKIKNTHFNTKIINNKTCECFYKIFIQKVIFNGPATIVFYKDEDGRERKCVAMCSEKDEFDENIGIQVAALKALRKEINRKLRKLNTRKCDTSTIA